MGCKKLPCSLGGCSPLSVLVWHMMAWWQLACNNVQPETFQPEGRFLHLRWRTDSNSSACVDACQCLSTVITIWQRLTMPVSWQQWQLPSSGAPWLIQQNDCQTPPERDGDPRLIYCENHMEFLIFRGICPPMLASSEGLIMMTVTTAACSWASLYPVLQCATCY